MKTTTPFGYPVNKAGLPRNFCTLPPSGYENILNLTPQELAKIYWLLDKIEINFAYSINGVHRQRTTTLSSNIEPIQRITTEPIFYHNETHEDGVESTIELALNTIAHNKTETLFDIHFKVEEQDENSLFTLSSNDLSGQRLIDKKYFNLMNREIPISLWSLSAKWSGKIEYLRAETDYRSVNTT